MRGARTNYFFLNTTLISSYMPISAFKKTTTILQAAISSETIPSTTAPISTTVAAFVRR